MVTNTREESGRKRSNKSSLSQLLSDEDTSMHHTQTKNLFVAMRS